MDDVVDFIEEIADFLALYRIEAPMEQSQQLARILLEASRLIAQAVPRLRAFNDIRHFTVEINRLENEGDRVVRQALASLFERGIDPMLVIRWKDIFERLEDALALQEAGCFAIVFEAIPNEVTDVIMEYMEIPVIGIGAGPSTDGQVLVLHDLLAIHQGFKPKFVKEYAAIGEAMVEGVRAYAEEVRSRAFPAPQHRYGIAPEELERLRGALRGQDRRVGLTS
jgi:hypothetical protein